MYIWFADFVVRSLGLLVESCSELEFYPFRMEEILILFPVNNRLGPDRRLGNMSLSSQTTCTLSLQLVYVLEPHGGSVRVASSHLPL